jgi:hypothetical protein
MHQFDAVVTCGQILVSTPYYDYLRGVVLTVAGTMDALLCCGRA